MIQEKLVENDVSRRGFLRLVGGVGTSFVLGSFTTVACARGNVAEVATADPGEKKEDKATAFVPNGYLKIEQDGTVTVTVFKSEMGQGVRTSLALLVAEDLDADWQKVAVVQAPGGGEPVGGQGTGGSSSVRTTYKQMREVGASARMMLVAAAAKQWGVEASACKTDAGKVIGPNGKTLTYGELAAPAMLIAIPDAGSVALKPKDEFKILGKGKSRLDNPNIVTGKAMYGLDIKVPGMKYAVIARPPNFGAKVASFDESAAKVVPGVKQVFQMGSGVAVIADNTWASIKGREALKIKWTDGPHMDVSSDSIHKALLAELVDHKPMPEGAKVVEATFDLPFIAHATMEPMNAVADVQADKCEIWAGCQTPDSGRDQVAQKVNLPRDSVKVNVCLLGGGFGRRLFTEYMVEAAEISQKAKCPIKLLWTREDDMKNDHYRSMSHSSFKGAVDASGNPVGWSHQCIRAEGGNGKFGRAGIPYKIDGASMLVGGVSTPVSTGPWRSVEHTQFDVVNECFIDELAHAAGQDPFEFRKKNMGDKRLLLVLETVAKNSGWGTPMPKGYGRGIACFAGYGTYAAHVVEVKVTGDTIKVTRVVAAIDPGIAVNPKGIESQMQSGCSDALSLGLRAAITVDNGAIVQNSWDDYNWLTLDAMPKFELTIIEGSDDPGGMGEPAFPSVQPALANAIFAATGKRVRKFPIQVSELV
ncbi:MAG TPA: molybdopterin cofactor-binding domain-containing protein [Fimbriimonadaceae bacterium]|jgi:CO/xanthine dehydrogenase Mo-binding subunit